MARLLAQQETVTATRIGNEAKDDRERTLRALPGTLCRIRKNDGEVIWPKVYTFGLSIIDEWFCWREPRAYVDDYYAWMVAEAA